MGSVSISVIHGWQAWWASENGEEEALAMSTVVTNLPETGSQTSAVIALPASNRPLHRLATVRRQEGISRRTVARRMKTTISDVKRQEDEAGDLLLSTLYKWQEALEVPMSELLVDCQEPLSSPLRSRAKMLRIMKTAVTILERTRQTSIRRMAQTLVDQLVELMPELEGIGPWPAVGKSRLPSDYGQVVHRRMPDEVFMDWGESE
jgi:transcriptional regulator with XRE-family HTH domain